MGKTPAKPPTATGREPSESLARQGADASDLVTLTRQDLAVSLEAYRRASRRQWVGVVIGLGGLAGGVALMEIRSALNWPIVLENVFFGLGWAILIGTTVVVTVRDRRMRAHYALACPQCGTSLFDNTSANPRSNAEMVIASGRCFKCKERILPLDAHDDS